MRGKEHDDPALPLLALPNRLMTIPEVAAYLNVPVRWIEDAVQRRRVRHTRIGKHVPAQFHAAVPLHDRRRSRL